MMFKNKKWIWVGVIGGLIAILGVGVFALTQVDNVMAAAVEVVTEDVFGWGPGGRGPGRGAGLAGFETDEALANYLGITEDEVEDAYQAAAEAAYNQAVEEGLIPEDQAGAPFRNFAAGGMSGMLGERLGIDFNALLADELGITVEELEDAFEAVREEHQAYQIDQGYLTEEDVAMMDAHRTVLEYIDLEAALEEKLGISLEELQAAREDGTRPLEILDELDLDMGDVQGAIQETIEEAVEAAVQDGAITQEQADELLDNAFLKGFGLGMGFPGLDMGNMFHNGGRGMRGQGGMRNMPGFNWPDND